MKYNPQKHITHDEFADLLGVTLGWLTRRLRIEHGPVPVGGIWRKGIAPLRFYDRTEVKRWIDKRSAPAPAEYRGEVVPPRDIYAIAKRRKEYRPSPQLRMNMARAGELYQHRLYTPDGIGNSREFAPGFDRGR